MKAGWEIKSLDNVTNIINGGTPKSAVSEFWGGEVAWLTPKDMGKLSNHNVSSTSRTITQLGLSKCSAKLIPENSIILSTRAPIGHLAINSVPMAFNQGCRGLVPNDSLILKYLFHYLSANIDVMNGLGTGTTFKELSAGALKSLQIPLPPLEEQKRIVSILDEAFEGLNRARENAEANLKSAQELFDATFNTLLTSTKNKVAAEWSISALGELCENLDNKRVPITKNQRVEGSIPYYGASGIVDYVQGHLFNEPLLLISEDGANLLARTYPIAFSIKGKTWVNNHAHVLRFDTAETRRFVELYLNSIPLDPYISGMAQPKLNQKKLMEIPIPIPNLLEQRRIIGLMDKCSDGYFQLESSYRTKLQDISDLRQSLLQKAFAGELT